MPPDSNVLRVWCKKLTNSTLCPRSRETYSHLRPCASYLQTQKMRCRPGASHTSKSSFRDFHSNDPRTHPTASPPYDTTSQRTLLSKPKLQFLSRRASRWYGGASEPTAAVTPPTRTPRFVRSVTERTTWGLLPPIITCPYQLAVRMGSPHPLRGPAVPRDIVPVGLCTTRNFNTGRPTF